MRRMVFMAAVLVFVMCSDKKERALGAAHAKDASDTLVAPVDTPMYRFVVSDTVLMRSYFKFIDGLVQHYDTITPYKLTEHLLVRSNPWIIDTLANMDYYRQLARGVVVYNQRLLPVFIPGDTIVIPSQHLARQIQDDIDTCWLDINIPEFRLRIMNGARILYTIPVRVGQNKTRYQEVLGRKADLRTRTGEGSIVKINREPPWFIDPHTGKKFTTTKRDDGNRTRMPLIPWLEPAINGVRLGQLIHPTTNPGTLERASSNGCIGTSEADAWRVYYYAPVGTRVLVRYDLHPVTATGDTLDLVDIYKR